MYPSFLTCMLLLGFSCTSYGTECLEHLKIGRIWCLLCAVCFMGSSFLHFTQPESQLYWITVGLFSLVYVIHSARRHPWPVLQALFIGVTVQLVAEQGLTWYPYTTWHGVPIYIFYAMLWCTVGWVFSENKSEWVIFITSISIVGILRGCAVLHYFPFNLSMGESYDVSAIGHMGQAICNQYWVALLIVIILEWIQIVWHGLKVRKFRVI